MVKALPKISFCLTSDEAKSVDEARQRLGKKGVLLNRSEMLRASIHALDAMSDRALLKAAKATPHLKPGRRVNPST